MAPAASPATGSLGTLNAAPQKPAASSEAIGVQDIGENSPTPLTPAVPASQAVSQPDAQTAPVAADMPVRTNGTLDSAHVLRVPRELAPAVMQKAEPQPEVVPSRKLKADRSKENKVEPRRPITPAAPPQAAPKAPAVQPALAQPSQVQPTSAQSGATAPVANPLVPPATKILTQTPIPPALEDVPDYKYMQR